MTLSLPLVVREDTTGLRIFKSYWQGQMVDAAIFRGYFYRFAAEFEGKNRSLAYEDALQRAETHQTLITVRDKDQSMVYTVWVDQWYDSEENREDKQDAPDCPSP